MSNAHFTRRAVLATIGAMVLVRPAAAAPAMHVLKDPNCGCCAAWIAIHEDAGFVVTTEASSGDALTHYKLENGIPRKMMSCHTARIGG